MTPSSLITPDREAREQLRALASPEQQARTTTELLRRRIRKLEDALRYLRSVEGLQRYIDKALSE